LCPTPKVYNIIHTNSIVDYRHNYGENAMPTVSVPLIEVPPLVVAADNQSDTYRGLVVHALRANAGPIAVESRALPRRSLFIPPILHAKIENVAELHDLTFQQAFLGLSSAGLALKLAENETYQQQKRAISPPPFAGASSEQVLYYQLCIASLENGRICMAEGSTGVGKSRALIMAAIHMARKVRVRKVVVTAPTLAILGHLWSEMEALHQEGIGQDVKPGFFPGIGEFVDTEKLTSYLNNAEIPDSAVEKWVANNGPCLQNTPLIRAMLGAGVKLHHMMEDLKLIATNLTAKEFMLKGGDDDERLQSARKAAADADIVFCTHTMLGWAQQSDWSLFGAPDVLIVDEGHMFEQNIASIHSDDLSLQMLQFRLREYQKSFMTNDNSVLGKAVTAADNLLATLRKYDTGKIGNVVRIGRSDTYLAEPINVLHCALKNKVFADFENIEKVRMMLGSISNALDGRNAGSFLSFSPDRRFPSLKVGQYSIGGILGNIWKSATQGAVIASATLFLPDRFGNQKCDYLAGILSVPRSRLDAPMPVVAPWVKSVPTIHYPDLSAAVRLARPTIQNRLDTENNWLNSLADTIYHILAKKTEGGSLVLATSYTQITMLADLLSAHGVGAERIVAQEPNVRFSVAETAFRNLHKAGKSPILLGLGAAWTGIDLIDKSVTASEDRLLTTLIIACIPVGLNRTSTMLARIEKTRLAPLISESLMLLRQGLGRAVRSSEKQNIDIWVLDGRPWAEWPGMSIWQASVRNLLGGYPRRETFPLY
jgi:hypothetical protein